MNQSKPIPDPPPMPGWTVSGKVQHWRKLADRFRDSNPDLAAQYEHWARVAEAKQE